MKKITITLFIISILMLMLPLTAEATIVDNGTWGDNITYKLDSDGKLTISGTGSMPTEGNSHFYYLDDKVLTIEVEAGITNVSKNAFKSLHNVTRVTLADSIQSIGEYAFAFCKSLTNIVIPDHMIAIGAGAFYECYSLPEIVIPNGVTRIEEGTFSCCESLNSVSIPESVTYIGEMAFNDCVKLTSIMIPPGVTSIHDWAFSFCTSLMDINVDNRNTVYSSYDGALYNKQMTELIICPPGKESITIPQSVTSIPTRAWDENDTILAPFDSDFVANLKSIQVSSENTAFSSIDGILYNKQGTELLRCPPAKSGMVAIPTSVSKIREWAFDYCKGLTGVSIPSSVRNIGRCAFRYCEQLAEVSIDDGVKNIGSGAFLCCYSLTNVNIPNSVTNIEGGVFSSCINLAKVNIPAGITKINMSTFYGCSSLSEISIPETVTEIDKLAFYNSGITSIMIPSCVTFIDAEAFGICENLTAIIVDPANENYTSSNGVLFNKDISTLIQFPSGIKGDYIIPDGVTTISNCAFYYCSLTNVTITEGVENIKFDAFSCSNNLKNIAIPVSIKSIDTAFDNCDNLSDIYYNGNEEQWNAIQKRTSLYDSLNTATIHFNTPFLRNILTLPESLTVIESEAFTGLPNVNAIRIPATITSISTDAFDHTVILLVPNETWAQWATDHGYDWR